MMNRLRGRASFYQKHYWSGFSVVSSWREVGPFNGVEGKWKGVACVEKGRIRRHGRGEGGFDWSKKYVHFCTAHDWIRKKSIAPPTASLETTKNNTLTLFMRMGEPVLRMVSEAFLWRRRGGWWLNEARLPKSHRFRKKGRCAKKNPQQTRY